MKIITTRRKIRIPTDNVDKRNTYKIHQRIMIRALLLLREFKTITSNGMCTTNDETYRYNRNTSILGSVVIANTSRRFNIHSQALLRSRPREGIHRKVRNWKKLLIICKCRIYRCKKETNAKRIIITTFRHDSARKYGSRVPKIILAEPWLWLELVPFFRIRCDFRCKTVKLQSSLHENIEHSKTYTESNFANYATTRPAIRTASLVRFSARVHSAYSYVASTHQ